MQVALTVRHGKIDDETRDYIKQKSEKLLTYFERVTEIDVTVDFESDRVGVEILVDAEHRHNFVSNVESMGDVRPTFDRALQKMEKQIRRYKGKLVDHRRDRPMNEVAELGAPDEDDD